MYKALMLHCTCYRAQKIASIGEGIRAAKPYKLIALENGVTYHTVRTAADWLRKTHGVNSNAKLVLKLNQLEQAKLTKGFGQ